MNKFKAQTRIRLQRLRNLRNMMAPAWIIKWEQMALALNRRGIIKVSSIGSDMSTIQSDLVTKHVQPLMDGWLEGYVS